MQATKIEVGGEYAVYKNVADNKAGLLTFKVTSVTTTRFRNTGSPHDYKSSVAGYVVDDTVEAFDANGDRKSITLDPKRLLGPVQEYAELMASKRLKEEARVAEYKAKEALKLDAARSLYQYLGVPVPNDMTKYDAEIRISHSGIEIRDRVLAALLAKLGDGNA